MKTATIFELFQVPLLCYGLTDYFQTWCAGATKNDQNICNSN